MRRIPGYSLWLGHVGDVADLATLHSAGIEALIDLALNERPAVLPREWVYCRFPLVDGSGNPPWLLQAAVETVASLLRAGTPTLVYCGAGMSRTPAIAGAAIALVRGCSPTEGLALLTETGPRDVSPALWHDIKALIRLTNGLS